jgi:hypothetical protein
MPPALCADESTPLALISLLLLRWLVVVLLRNELRSKRELLERKVVAEWWL